MKFISFILLLILAQSCGSKRDSTDLQGAWSNCASDGYYLEMHIQDNQYRYVTNSNFISPWSEFELNGTTLTQFSKNTDTEIDTLEAELIFISNNQIQIKYPNSKDSWVMERVIADVDISVADAKLLEGLLERAKNSKCNDSIFAPEEFIYFQF
ncbi:MAG: hypothetical protein ACI8Q1_001396 [Parvicella sp.]|jgi:hypothetical protein